MFGFGAVKNCCSDKAGDRACLLYIHAKFGHGDHKILRRLSCHEAFCNETSMCRKGFSTHGGSIRRTHLRKKADDSIGVGLGKSVTYFLLHPLAERYSFPNVTPSPKASRVSARQLPPSLPSNAFERARSSVQC